MFGIWFFVAYLVTTTDIKTPPPDHCQTGETKKPIKLEQFVAYLCF